MTDTVCICSIFRDSESRRRNELHRYFVRLHDINYPIDNLRFSFFENDSTDGTLQKLREWVSGPYGYNCVLSNAKWGNPFYGSTVHPVRFRDAGTAANTTLDQANDKWGKEIDWYWWVESDLIWDKDLLSNLIKSANELHTKFLSPMIYIEQPDGRFYDTYAYIDWKRRENFKNDPPFHPDFNKTKPMRMFSVGSCMLMHGDVIRAGVRWEHVRSIIDLCDNAGKAGFEIWLDPRLEIYHPR